MAIGRQRVEAGQGALAGHDKDTDKHESQDDNKVCSSVARKLLPSFDQSENQTLPKQQSPDSEMITHQDEFQAQRCDYLDDDDHTETERDASQD